VSAKTGLEPLAELMVEKLANDGAGGMTVLECYALSQAISLKRIADALNDKGMSLAQWLGAGVREGRGGH
jgi:hypothetical protein